MVRPLRLEFPGALYYVTSRGDKYDIYLDEDDRRAWLEVLDQVCHRFKWIIFAYCQMDRDFHLLVETMDCNLAKGMRQLNGVYTQYFNLRHNKTGPLYRGRYKAILVQKKHYLLAVTRHIALLPLYRDMTTTLENWPWSSYPATIDTVKAPQWLARKKLLNKFAKKRKKAIQAYRQFIMEGKGLPSPLEQTQHQILLGDDDFVARYQQGIHSEFPLERAESSDKANILPLHSYQQRYPNKKEAMARAYLSGAYTMAQIGDHFGVNYMTVSRAVRQFEKKDD
ncbi:MAG TPA: addiction module toxin RelE [Nitrosomonas nitrosa]|nr:addiction module toxin RelE [Nitrosomonas nitrosa]HNP51755.1 transposase [Nitrosomonas nitrosa]